MDVHLKYVFGGLQEQFGSGPGLGPRSGTNLMKIDGVAPPFIKYVFRAATGIYLFRSNNDAKKITGPRETIRVPNVEVLRVTYELDTIMLPLTKRFIMSLALEVLGEN
ncbi:hypothetical protein P3S67_022585 [Capsicum chacoense]|uniref:Uncharacterized protein n=1 Tax=Capsicum annuum TaxID=4072 RepID=A0A2G3A5C0_CAPAN|nr:hypothetical protein T459_04504 [Capsicum annuum]